MLEKITQITGKEKGPTSMILVGVHGNEKCGIKALKKILPKLKIEKGRVFLGFGNPRAIEKNKRFTQANLNRMFKADKFLSGNEKKSYEYKRAQFLKKYMGQVDALLDIHASSIPKSRAFIICENDANKIAQYLPTNLVVSGFNEIEPGGTDSCMKNFGKIGIAIECGYLAGPKSEKVARESIFAFLKAQGHIKNDLPPRRQKNVRMYYLHLTKTNDFTLTKPFKKF
jgi:succinylglutamate desuccinylase